MMSSPFVSDFLDTFFPGSKLFSTCTKTKQQPSRHCCFFSSSTFFQLLLCFYPKGKAKDKPRVCRMERQMMKSGFSHISKPLPPRKPSQSAAAQLCTPGRRWRAAQGGVLLMWVPPCGTVLSRGSGEKSHLLPRNNLFLQKASGFTAGWLPRTSKTIRISRQNHPWWSRAGNSPRSMGTERWSSSQCWSCIEQCH